MSYFAWAPYVSVAERRRQAEVKLAKLVKRGEAVAPVKIEGRIIAKINSLVDENIIRNN